ncbi:MAG: translocation/assembly module TamB, partial [Bacteroidota bacterium]|nr:translocation/assembly module TamB [Bacteroidota bacterium]
VTDTSGLFIKNFRADVFYGDNTMHLQDVLFETPQTLIRDQVELHYPSIDSIAKDPGVLNIRAHLVDSRLAIKDLILFAPVLANQDPFRQNRNAVILMNGQIDGPISDLTFTNLTVSGLGQIRLKGSGTITGLPDINKSTFDLRIEEFSATKNDITGFLPAGTFPSNISLPDRLQLKGSFVGSMMSFTTNMNVNSSYGNALIKGTFKNLTSKTRASYNATLTTTQFDAGRFLKMEDKLGKITFAGTIKGTGMDPKTANATFDGKISAIQYNGYTYQNLTAKGSARNGDIELTANMVDPNINFDLKGTANLNGEYPKVNMTLNLDTLNLLPLKLNDKDLSLKGQIIADLETADQDYLNGTINITDAIIRLEDKRYKLDTISIVSVATEGEDSLHIYSELLTARFKGNYNLTKVWPAMQQSIDNYFDTTPARDSTIAYDPQQLEFNIRIIRSPLVEELLPDLTEMEDAVIEGNFDSTTDEIVVKGSAPRMMYKDFVIDNFGLDINTENNALNYSFTLDQLRKKEIQIQNLSFSGKAQNDVVDMDLQIKDENEENVYRIAGKMKSEERHFDLSILQDGLVLNRQAWTVAPDNAIQFGSEGLMVTNFKISHEEQSMRIHSNPQQKDAPMDLSFEDFKIATLTRMVKRDSLLADGIINGVANVRNLKTNPVFTADLDIEDFSFHEDTVGNIALKVNNETPDTYAAEAKITGYGNDVTMKGSYIVSGASGLFDLNVDIVNLNMKSIEGFTGGEIDNASGALTGDLSLKGTMASPAIRGDIRFNAVGFKVTRFNSYYQVKDENIQFTTEGIDLDLFTLVDSSGNEAVISGNIYTKDYRDYRFDLDLQSDNFQVMNSTRENNKLYYGQLYVDAHLHVHGGLATPVVDGSIRVNDKTKLTIVIPQTDPGLIEREGIVEFVDMDTFKLAELTPLQDSLIQSELTGMDVAVDISIVKEAELNMIIDEANGDYLNVRGQADLAGGIDPSGKMTLTGIYELEEGAYRFSFNQVKREFQIAKGSTISWTGDPLLADVNVTAIYVANTAPLSLVQNQLADADQNVVNTYKQKLPFEVMLDMKGKLLQPEVTFDIDLPTKNYGVSTEVITTVQSRLVQLRTEPSELNKQVFAVLLLNRFISDDPFVNEARGGGISSLARQSASKLLSEQLNNLVGGMIAGFELSFDLNSIEDYTSGELQNRTDLTVGLTKQLLDDRLKVSVGSNFELEGTRESDRKATNIAGDVSVEYQLSKDGRYLVRAYRKDEYIIVQGQVVETGIGFVFTADYNRFKDIFAKKTEDEKLFKNAHRHDDEEDKEVDEE